MPERGSDLFKRYPIVADSGIIACDTTLPVTVVPNSITLEKNTHPTSDFRSPAELFDAIRQKGIPTTSGANVGDYIYVFVNLARQGAQEISVFTIPEALSISHRSAVVASEQMISEFPDLKINVVPMSVVSEASRFLIQSILENMQNYSDATPDMQKIIRDMLEIEKRTHMTVALGPDSLKFAIAGGRVNLPLYQQIIANAVPIKIAIRFVNGALDQKHPIKKLGYGQIFGDMVNELPENRDQITQAAVVYTNEKMANQLSDKVKKRINISPQMVEASPDLSVHAGPEAAALAWQVK